MREKIACVMGGDISFFFSEFRGGRNGVLVWFVDWLVDLLNVGGVTDRLIAVERLLDWSIGWLMHTSIG